MQGYQSKIAAQIGRITTEQCIQLRIKSTDMIIIFFTINYKVFYSHSLSLGLVWDSKNPKKNPLCGLVVLSFFNLFYFISRLPYKIRCLIISPSQKYFDFALSLIINFLDHIQVWCRLSWTQPLAKLEVVQEVCI